MMSVKMKYSASIFQTAGFVVSSKELVLSTGRHGEGGEVDFQAADTAMTNLK